MPSIFQKLNFKAQPEIVVFNAPASFEAELDRLSTILAASSKGDALLWFAYPKGSSKR
jgi:hypothetical protein